MLLWKFYITLTEQVASLTCKVQQPTWQGPQPPAAAGNDCLLSMHYHTPHVHHITENNSNCISRMPRPLLQILQQLPGQFQVLAAAGLLSRNPVTRLACRASLVQG